MPPAIVWIGWLILFLIYELYAAWAPPLGDTLSENVWKWFGVRQSKPFARYRRGALALFMVTLTCHFVLGEPGGEWIVLTGLPVAGIILYAALREASDVQ
jgi:hypothetical protein